MSGLTLLLTASDMDPACEASLTVCGSHGQSGLLDELGRCNLNEKVSSWHGMGQCPGAQQPCYCLPCEPPWTNPV